MARTARNYRDVKRSNLKATRRYRRAKAKAYKKLYPLPKPLRYGLKSIRKGYPQFFGGRNVFKSKRVVNRGSYRPLGLKHSRVYPVMPKKKIRYLKSGIVRR